MLQKVNIITQAFVNGLIDILKDKLHGVYIYGAAAFPDDVPTGDIDFHVILKSELTDNERSELEEFHNSLASKFHPLGGELDGYYILLADALRKIPPQSQLWKRATDKSWALHREHILAGRCIVLHGPAPEEIYQPASWPEIETALYEELDFIEKHLDKYPAYCILNMCRLIYSFETKDVVLSKAQASDWAYNNLSQWKRHIELARKSYAHQSTAEDNQFLLTEVEKFLDFTRESIEQTCQKEKNNINMEYRPAYEKEYDTIYMMGYDTWSEGKSVEEYLSICRTSKKYKSGRWFILSEDSILKASLLIHSFNDWGTRVIRGIGSVATQPEFRQKGYGHKIVKESITDLTRRENTSIIFLYSDISPDFYMKHSFVTLPEAYQTARNSVLMALMLPRYDEAIIEEYRDQIPKYF